MTKNFLALAKAEIDERITIEDSLVNAYIDPVYERGYEFSGEVIIRGTINDDADEGTLSAILQDYLREYVEFARVTAVQFEVVQEKENYGRYQRTG